ncbi:MAG: prepilin peptidase [Candidatus Delongbacteria bacterium]
MISETFRIFFSSWYVYLIFGMIFGSFLNVVIYRVPEGMSLINPPSSCPQCGHMIRWYENIPVFSWIFLKGKCSSCGKNIPAKYPVIELAVGMMTLGLFLYTGPDISLLILIPLSYILFCIAVIDYQTFSIPYGLNMALFIVAALGVILNFFIDGLLNISLLGSFLGALTGFGILYLIQITGKLIYKQDAVGTGDLYLFASAGLLMGPKLTFTAFILGSFLAVLSYSVPSIINLLNKRKDTLFYFNKALKMISSELEDINEKAEITGLKMQLYHSLKCDKAYNEEKQKLLEPRKNTELTAGSLLNIFFRFSAVNDPETASLFLKRVNEKKALNVSEIRNVCSGDMIGYDSAPDNFSFLYKHSNEAGLEKLSDFLTENKKIILKKNETDDLNKLSEILNSDCSDKEKLDLFLQYNRYFQFNGFVAEQKAGVNMIESSGILNNSELKQKYLSDLSLVYFKDFFFEESRQKLRELDFHLKSNDPSSAAVKNILNIALFRSCFFKQRLAFGPFLAAGIMLSILWGERFLDLYYKIMEKLFL